MTLHVTNDNNKLNVVFERIVYIVAGIIPSVDAATHSRSVEAILMLAYISNQCGSVLTN
jgi:hypothetical protein